MLIEEFQDYRWVHGHLLCVNGVILVILSLPKAWRIPPSFCSIGYMGWKRCCLKNKKMSVNFLTIFFESPGCMMHSIKFLLKRIYGLEEVVWKIPRRLFIAWPSLISEWNKRSISKSLSGLTYSINFLLMRRYGFEEHVVWRISRWLFSGWPSMITEWND